jgi:hypothetical protein
VSSPCCLYHGLIGATTLCQCSFIESERADIHFFLRIALHTSDVSNPARRMDYSLEWTTRVVDEFYAQGDQERARDIPISAFMDRWVTHTVVVRRTLVGVIVDACFCTPILLSASPAGDLELSWLTA